MIFEPHQGTTARLFGGLFLCQFLAVACFSGLSKIAYFRLIPESGIKRETVRNFSPRYTTAGQKTAAVDRTANAAR
ncbi:TPA: hypothetical protein U7N74_002284 [Serratia marcescens]|nr:hypothetical protein [Serratia marcescens]HEN7411273.1 hypothetical protein [Serratia marcescens]